MQCMIGAMSTGAAATGARSFLASRHFSWLTPRRMRLVTVSLLGAALFASAFIVSGSTPRPQAGASGGAGSVAVVHQSAR
jgi:hypothetical protein